MLCRYSVTIQSSCPVDEKPDTYAATFESSTMIKVEDILEAVRRFASEPSFQESLTSSLARVLNCKVTTMGWHSGVAVEVIAP